MRKTLVFTLLLASILHPVYAAPQSEATLMFTGDMMLTRRVAKYVVEKASGDYTHPFKNVAEVLRSADLAVGNLESPLSGRGERIPNKRIVFNASPEAVQGLIHAGFDLVTIANNHILDYGPQAMQDTRRHLELTGIEYCGISDASGEPQYARIREVNGLRIAFLGYGDPVKGVGYPYNFLTYPVRPAEGRKPVVARDIKNLKGKADIIVVCIHWGHEYKPLPSARQKELGRYMIDCGADIIAGHHPHVTQPIELYKDGVIIYSMGNFVFDQYKRPPTTESMIVKTTVNKKGLTGVEILPIKIPRSWQPTPCGPWRPAGKRYTPEKTANDT
jgi:poly-gamma-glutamate capsule biosynthesis protein CapA/YwtB (metallophosphatase superfamily)